MKIIHCADLHIDSKKFGKFSPEKRALKRHQMLQNFVDMVEYAEQNQVTAILLCGDIFDEPKVLKKSEKVVQETILAHPDITFFYIWGNHDEYYVPFEKYPSNFVVFGSKFGKIDFGDICIGGISFQRNLSDNFYETINFQKNDYSILMMHGPVLASDKYSSPIDVKKMEARFVDYLALGHIHKKEEGTLGKKGIWAYSGCLEAATFSYTGKDIGFYVLDVKDKKMTKIFVPFAKYFFQNVEIDVTNLKNIDEIFDKIEENTHDFGNKDIVRITFVGQRKEDEEINLNLFAEKYSNAFFYVEFEDQTKMILDLEKYANEKLSLKAEFIREVMSDKTLTEEEKKQICIVGLEALKGEDISI